jgi:hypothetical protein
VFLKFVISFGITPFAFRHFPQGKILKKQVIEIQINKQKRQLE